MSPSPVHLDFYEQHPAHLRTESYTCLLAHKLEHLHTRCPEHLQLGAPSSDIPTLTILGDSTPQTSGPRNALLEAGWGPQAGWALGSFLEPEAPCVSSGSCLSTWSLALQPAWVGLSGPRVGRWFLPLPLPHLIPGGQPSVPQLPRSSQVPQTLGERGPGGSASHSRHSVFYLCPGFWSLSQPPSLPSSLRLSRCRSPN